MSRQTWMVAAGLCVVMVAAGCDRPAAEGSVTPYAPPSGSGESSSSPAPASSSAASPSVSRTSASPSAAPSTSGSPSVTLPSAPSTVIPTASGSQTPNSLALLKEAEAVARIVWYETSKAEAEGGASELPPRLKALIEPGYAELVLEYLKFVKSKGLRIENGDKSKLLPAKPLSTAAEPGAEAGLSVCAENSDAVLVYKDGKRSPAKDVRYTFFFNRGSDGVLRIYTGNVEEVSC